MRRIIPLVIGTILIFSLYLAFNYSKRFFHKTKIDANLSENKILTFLVHGLDDDKKVNLSLFVFLHPPQRKIGLFFINPLITFKQDGETVEEMGPRAMDMVIQEIESISNLKVNYTFTITNKEFKRAINILGGLDFYFDPTISAPSKDYVRSIGDYHIYGEEVLGFLDLPDNPDPMDYIARMNKQKSILLSLYDKIKDSGEVKKEWVLFFEKDLKTILTGPELFSLVEYLMKGNLIFSISEMPAEPLERNGKEILLSKSDTATFTFTKLASYLDSGDYNYGELVRSEVLNSTEKNGLAKDVKSILNESTFKVLTVGNGWRANEKESIIIDRSGNTEFSYKIAKILGIKTVRHIIDKELGLDTTILLGEDFEIKPRK